MSKSNVLKFRTRFHETPRVQLVCPDTPEDRRTKSEFADECDINKIMARYKRTGVLPEFAQKAAARFGDFSQVPTFTEMQEKIIAANELFLALPAAVRKQFDNDPGQFIAASESQEGRELLVKLGLGKAKESQPPGSAPRSSAGQAEPDGAEPSGAPVKGAGSSSKALSKAGGSE